MIKISVSFKNKQTTIVATGHANFNDGNDIVCSAVSALLYTLIGALAKETEITSEDEKDVFKIVILKDSQNTKVILNTILSGIVQIQKAYPENVKLLFTGGGEIA